MPNALQDELLQTVPFGSPAEEAHLSIRRTDALLAERLDRLFKPHGLSGTQYNVLRILHGAGRDGLCRNEIRDRLVSRMPDVTRLLDRMEESGLIVRARDGNDRRLVSTRLTERGERLVQELDGPVAAEHARAFSGLTTTEIAELIRLLARVRACE